MTSRARLRRLAVLLPASDAPLAPVPNNQRDGLLRQTIPRGRVSYEPDSLAGGCPFQAGTAQASASVVARLDEREEQAKEHAKPDLFASTTTRRACSSRVSGPRNRRISPRRFA